MNCCTNFLWCETHSTEVTNKRRIKATTTTMTTTFFFYREVKQSMPMNKNIFICMLNSCYWSVNYSTYYRNMQSKHQISIKYDDSVDVVIYAVRITCTFLWFAKYIVVIGVPLFIRMLLDIGHLFIHIDLRRWIWRNTEKNQSIN